MPVIHELTPAALLAQLDKAMCGGGVGVVPAVSESGDAAVLATFGRPEARHVIGAYVALTPGAALDFASMLIRCVEALDVKCNPDAAVH